MTSEATAPEAALRDQFETAFARATYPVKDPFELIPVLPDGPATEFTTGDVTIPAIDLGMIYGEYQTYPYHSVDALVEDLIAGLKAEGTL